MESISIAKKIVQDSARSYKILQDTTRFYGILDKNAMESISIENKILQDLTRSYKILRDTRQKCYGTHIDSKQDPTRSYKILKQPTRVFGILDKNDFESLSIGNKNLQDSTG